MIPGGFSSVADLKTAASTDPLIASHYQGFDIERAVIVIAPKSALLYASYRKGGNTYWTSRPIHIGAGETLATDGRNLIRARCGNRLSPRRRLPIEVRSPSEAELDAPEVSLPPAPAVTLPDSLTPVNALAFEIFPEPFPRNFAAIPTTTAPSPTPEELPAFGLLPISAPPAGLAPVQFLTSPAPLDFSAGSLVALTTIPVLVGFPFPPLQPPAFSFPIGASSSLPLTPVSLPAFPPPAILSVLPPTSPAAVPPVLDITVLPPAAPSTSARPSFTACPPSSGGDTVVTPAPEPAAAALLLLGIAMAAAVPIRRRPLRCFCGAGGLCRRRFPPG